MTRKKIQAIYGRSGGGGGNGGLPTWYEDPGYEEWVIKREHLARLYYRQHEYQREMTEHDMSNQNTQYYDRSNQNTQYYDRSNQNSQYYDRSNAINHVRNAQNTLNNERSNRNYYDNNNGKENTIHHLKKNSHNHIEADMNNKNNSNSNSNNNNNSNNKLQRINSVKRKEAENEKQEPASRNDKKKSEMPESKIAELVEKRVEHYEEELSMWSCRKCTLDNPLIDKVCAACGGSRLCSIGDIDVPAIFRCDQVQKMIEKDEEEKASFMREKKNDNLFERNKRLSKIDDEIDEEDARNVVNILDKIDVKFLLALSMYLITFMFLFNF